MPPALYTKTGPAEQFNQRYKAFLKEQQGSGTPGTGYAPGYSADLYRDMAAQDPRSGMAGRHNQTADSIDPFAFEQRTSDFFANDPRFNQAWAQGQGGLVGMGVSNRSMLNQAQGLGRASQNFLQGAVKQLGNRAAGRGPMLADAYGAQQRMQAMGDIAQQTAMAGRGGNNPALARASILQQANVGANMASGIAAARLQEQQAAMQQFMQARQAQLDARGMAIDAMGNVSQSMGNQAGRGRELADSAAQYRGGIFNAMTGAGQQFGDAIRANPKTADDVTSSKTYGDQGRFEGTSWGRGWG
jgi:hypothetical protein